MGVRQKLVKLDDLVSSPEVEQRDAGELLAAVEAVLSESSKGGEN